MEWIPTSVRMPSEQGQYLVTFPLCNGEPWVYILSFNKGKFYETDDEWGDVEYDDVTAWMPLPKPYAADTPQTDCATCKYGRDKHRYAHICNECGVGINNYTPQTETHDLRTETHECVEQTDCGWK